MNNPDCIALQQAIQKGWPETYFDQPKVKRYVDKFWDRQRMERKITAVVQGNHGNYTITIEAQDGGLWSTCSCYKGKHGYCHHCVALGQTFLDKPDSFVLIEKVEKTAASASSAQSVTDLDTLHVYLKSVTLDELTKQMRAKGITQKAFCEAIGMKPQHLTAVKSSERRNRRFHELGAIKLAVLWTLEHLGE